ncbi:hypothetical protein NMY3_02966 [Candidatus Nitrosocosmicus oleophilus]|jgi:hypothetical protein|uniref:Uncharacterized protein n=1 Tax=Candidatus Nitrosocosmicus oleophilus TaxID=1353260 RepID=A0A654M3A4_9ARCH|nr:hypothetical protein [Candidatus Nitrosocosmicus oleophilus]ALI37153.1 hypothetical protein NMY3_02966 [Candidatus Nitrosocosmicus oleophilus]
MTCYDNNQAIIIYIEIQSLITDLEPLDDYRKYCLWRILCPYLIKIRKMSKEEASIILKDWLEKCDKLRKLEFNPQREVNIRLKNVKSFLPSSKETLKKEQPELYSLLVKYEIIQMA